MAPASPRVAVRAIIIEDDRLLLVNAYGDHRRALWCAPGGGVEKHASLPDNLVREVREETGLTVSVGAPALINEFHDPGTGFHQVEVFFRARVAAGVLDARWIDPAGVVNKWIWATQAELADLHLKPRCLPEVAFSDGPVVYDPLELLI